MTISKRATKRICAAAAVLLLAGASGADQGNDHDNGQHLSVNSPSFLVPVVELYTSEGCSSCPRADQWISKLGKVIDDEFSAVPLAFHVDYWNYLGWEDPFSKPLFTKRQRELGAINRQGSIYTPEFLVSGQETRGTSAVVAAIKRANGQSADVAINMQLRSIDESRVEVSLDIENQHPDGVLYLAIYENGIVRQIAGGENSGRTLEHDFVVRHWDSVANIKSGQFRATHTIELGDDWNREKIGVAAIVADRRDAMTLQSVRLDLGPLFSDDNLAVLERSPD